MNGERKHRVLNWSVVRNSLSAQPWVLLFGIAAGVAALTLTLLFCAFVWGMHPEVLLRDPNALAVYPAYSGLIATLGAALWLASGGCALLAWAATAAAPSAAAVRGILLFGGALTVVLALDDLLMLHEGVLPILGVPEIVVFAGYGVLGSIFLLRIQPAVFTTEWPLLAVGMVAFAGSIFADLFFKSIWTGQLILEDVIFKLSGILFWSLYFIRLSFSVLSSRMAR